MADKENVSSFFDGEDRDKRVIEALGSDSDAQASWKSYSVIRDTLRGEAPATLDWDIASSVSAALENEPSYSRDIDHQPAMPANVEPLRESQPRPKTLSLPGWLQPVGQVGIAAAVCMAILIGVQTQPPGSDSPILAEATSQPPILETIPFSGAAEPVSLSREVEKPNAVSDEQLREQRLRINALLQDFELQLRLNADAVEPKTELQE